MIWLLTQDALGVSSLVAMGRNDLRAAVVVSTPRSAPAAIEWRGVSVHGRPLRSTELTTKFPAGGTAVSRRRDSAFPAAGNLSLARSKYLLRPFKIFLSHVQMVGEWGDGDERLGNRDAALLDTGLGGLWHICQQSLKEYLAVAGGRRLCLA